MSASTETSPLLPAHTEPAEEPAEGPSADVQLEANHGAPLVAQNHQRAIKIIQILLFATSIAATGFAVSSLLMCRISVFSHPYLLDFLGAFVLMVTLALFLSSINLKWDVPYIINLIADLGLMLYLAGSTYRIVSFWPSDSWCRRRDDDLDGSIYWACMNYQKVLQALLGMSATLAVLICAFHLALLVLRTVVSLKQRAWPGSSQLGVWLPTGEITLSFTIRILRQQRGMESPDRRAALNVEYGTLPEST